MLLRREAKLNLMQEQTEIKMALIYFWNCRACKRLGWDKLHGCPKNNADCGIYVYKKLKEHFEAIYSEQGRMH